MDRPRLLRRLILSTCFLAGAFEPAAALAHGYAHHEAAHHQERAGDVRQIGVPDHHHGDHPHLTVDRGLTIRWDLTLGTALVSRAAPLTQSASPAQLQPLEAALAPRWSSTHAPPPGTRAPPIA